MLLPAAMIVAAYAATLGGLRPLFLFYSGTPAVYFLACAQLTILLLTAIIALVPHL